MSLAPPAGLFADPATRILALPFAALRVSLADAAPVTVGMPAASCALPRINLIAGATPVDPPMFRHTIGHVAHTTGHDAMLVRTDTWTPMEEVAGRMVEILAFTLAHRRKLLRRDRKMREGFERDIDRFGGGASPLWLRMEPMRFDSRASDLFRLPYVALDIRLGIHQVWAPSGVERVGSPPQLRRIYAQMGTGHRRNVERLRTMRATGSLGWISDVALALIEQTGRNPAAVFKQELDAALHGGSHDHYGCDGHFGALFCHYGVLNPFFTFNGGGYSDGTLTIDGRYPEVLAIAAPGRLLAEYVNHPAFAAAGAVIERAEWSEERLKLHHTPRLFTVEEAERRWSEGQASEQP